MSDINWKENAVCYANGEQWVLNEDVIYSEDISEFVGFESVMRREDFQLNEIREGDFIPASELDTEQKYNDVVEVFELFGFDAFEESAKRALSPANKVFMADSDGTFIGCAVDDEDLTRKITCSQVIAIGKLKRIMLDREKSGAVSGADLTADNADQVKNPKHYQLIEGVESIEIIARSMTKEQWKGFCLGNMLKYRIRAGKKDALKQDIAKADFYGDLYEMHKEKCYD